MEQGYYAILPASVRYDKQITPSAKLLYAEITALSDRSGVCWAENAYFAKLYGVSVRSIRTWISSLVDCGYLYRDIQYGEDGSTIISRGLVLSDGRRTVDADAENEECDTPDKAENVASGGREDFPRGEEKNFRTLGKKTSIPPTPPYKEKIINNNILSHSAGACACESFTGGFIKSYPDIELDVGMNRLNKVDFEALLKSFDESRFLRSTFKSFSKILRNYKAIINGNYRDFERKEGAERSRGSVQTESATEKTRRFLEMYGGADGDG